MPALPLLSHMVYAYILYDGLDGGDLKCPVKSNQNNVLEVYSTFFQTVAEFKGLESLPTSVKFSEEHDAEAFLKNQAKWHKGCHLKFAPSKLLHKRHLSCESASDQQLRKSK